MGMTEFQSGVIDALNAQDTKNEQLLDQVVNAANAVSDTDSDVALTDAMKDFDTWMDTGDNSLDADENGIKDGVDKINASGGLAFGGKVASLQGTGGVALLEYAKDAIQTAVSNISGMGTNSIMAKKKVEQKLGPIGA